GLSLEAQTDLATTVEEELRDVPGVEVVQVTVGGGGGMLGAFGGGGGGDSATFSVTTALDADTSAVIDDIRARMDGLTDVGELQVTAGGQYSSDVVVNITAPDTDVLTDATEQVHAQLKDLDGVTDVGSSLTAAQPRVEVIVDEEKAAEKGLSGTMVAQSLRGLISPATLGSLEQDGSTIDIVLKVGEPPASLTELKELELTGPAGPVELQDIASVRTISIAPAIN